MSLLDIAFHDAATNCSRDGGVATLTLKSGVQITGKLDAPNHDCETLHVKTRRGGWATLLRDEVATVEVQKDDGGW